MSEIGFYHLQRSAPQEALPKLLEKALGAGFRTVVLAPDETALALLDAVLWTYDKESFLPHGIATEDHAEEQPILLTLQPQAPNGADMLVQTGGAEWGDLLPFRRVLDLFDGRDPASLGEARQRWRRYKTAGHEMTYWQQRPQGGWERKA